MSRKPPSGTEPSDPFLSRWSRRKHEAARGERPAEPLPAANASPAAAPVALAPETPVPAPLPDVESLTPEADFVPFMQSGVAESLKRRALKTLFEDPRFNVMDGLDVYIDDYSKPDPLPEGWLEKMNQLERLSPPRAETEAPEAPAENTSCSDITPSAVSSAERPETPVKSPRNPEDSV